MISVYLQAVTVLAPGLAGWMQSQPVLAGVQAYRAQALALSGTTLLPANERRRATPTIKLALQAAGQALEQLDLAGETLWSVFATSGGDGRIIDSICKALTLEGRPVSPTQFHNSVHNAPAGYWSIATASQRPSVSLSAHEGTFSAGLLDAAVTAAVEGATVLLVAYDHPLPPPLGEKRPMIAPFACAFILSAERGKANTAKLNLTTAVSGKEDKLADAGLEDLRRGNPAARSLPLLQALAAGKERAVTLPYLNSCWLCVGIEPGG